jgi:hypothetical protein
LCDSHRDAAAVESVTSWITAVHEARSNNDWQGDFTQFYELTERGREYLRLPEAV